MTAPLKDDGATEIDLLLSDARPIGGEEFAVIYRRYKRILTRYAADQGASDPEGIADLALLDGYRALDRLDNRSEAAFRRYVNRATSGHVVNEYRRSAPATEEVDEIPLIIDDHADGITDRLWLDELIAQLSPDQRDVIVSKYFLGLDGVETGKRLGKEPNAVHQLHHRALGSLRRLCLAAALAGIAVLGVLAIREAMNVARSVDSAPVDTPVNKDTSATTSTPDSTVQSEQQGAEQQNEVGGQTDGTVEAGPQLAPSEPSTTDPPERPASSITTAPAPPQTTAPASTSVTRETSTTAPPTTVAPTTSPSPPVRTPTALNHCGPQLINPNQSNVKLYNPSNNAGRAADFVPPAAIRFVDGDGSVLYQIDTSGPMNTGLTSGIHGWIGASDGSGSYARYEDAPPPRFWGVLVDAAVILGWDSIQSLDPTTGSWATVGAC